MIELYPNLRKVYTDEKLQVLIEHRLSVLPYLFRKDDREKDSSYTERPDLSQVDRLNQARIKMILDSLQDDSVLRELGRQAFNDMEDKKTEHGGIVMFDGNNLKYV